MAIDKLGHVKSQLDANSGRFRPKYENGAVKIACPYHGGGRERTPSCSVRLTGNIGSFNCFACKESGSWNKLARDTGLAGFKKSDMVNDVFSFIMPEPEYTEKSSLLEDYESLRRFDAVDGWRTIGLKTLKLFNARYPRHPNYNQNDFLYLPALVHGRHVGGIYARRVVTKEGKERGELSYINTKGAWTKKNLFGYDIAKKRKGPLWYVEGPRDTMKVAQLGGRVVGGLGAYVGEHKLRLVEQLDPPYLICATDPDAAGDTAREFMHKNMKGIPIVDAEFPEGKDPGCLTPKSYARMMREMGFEKYVD